MVNEDTQLRELDSHHDKAVMEENEERQLRKPTAVDMKKMGWRRANKRQLRIQTVVERMKRGWRRARTTKSGASPRPLQDHRTP